MADSSFSDAQIPRIFLWCVPRSCSTAFTKMMSFVDGVEIWFEPYVMSFFQKFYLDMSENKAAAEMRSKIKAQVEASSSGTDFGNQRLMSTFSYESTKDLLEEKPLNPDAKFIFVKDMAHVIDGMYEFLPQKVPWKHVFLIRHPYRFVPSYLNLMKPFRPEQKEGEQKHDDYIDPLLRSGRDQILALWKHVSENIDPDPVVIDSDDMQKKPGEILPRLFGRLGIPWKDSYLKWSEDTAFLKSWITAIELSFDKFIHRRAKESSHFEFDEKPLPDINDMQPDAIRLVNIYMPGYEEMYKHALK